MKTIDDALEVRGRIFGAFELAELEDGPGAPRRMSDLRRRRRRADRRRDGRADRRAVALQPALELQADRHRRLRASSCVDAGAADPAELRRAARAAGGGEARGDGRRDQDGDARHRMDADRRRAPDPRRRRAARRDDEDLVGRRAGVAARRDARRAGGRRADAHGPDPGRAATARCPVIPRSSSSAT